MDAISVAVERGALVESVHRVHAVRIQDGEIVEARGDPGLVTYLRSAAKPLQALPLAGLDVPERELAIACASHEALPEQLAAVESLLARAGAREEDLECGERDGRKLRHNCSGKHAGMLLVARERGWPWRGYALAEHPLQRELLDLVAEATAVPAATIAIAVDGCGVSTFAVALHAMATGFSRLSRGELPGGERVLAAMRAFPELVGGPDTVDSRLMRALPGAIAKRGAEGVLCVGMPDGTAAALKVQDGAQRALAPAVADFLGVPALAESPVRNSRGDIAGRIRVL